MIAIYWIKLLRNFHLSENTHFLDLNIYTHSSSMPNSLMCQSGFFDDVISWLEGVWIQYGRHNIFPDYFDLFSESSVILVLFAAKCVYDIFITHAHIHRNRQAHTENQILNDMGTEEKLRFNIDFFHQFLLFHVRSFLVYKALCQPFDIWWLFFFVYFFVWVFLLSTHNFIQYFLITEWHSCAYNQFIQFISYYQPY